MSEINSLTLTAGTAAVSAVLAGFGTFCPPITHVLDDVTGETRDKLDFGQQAGMVSAVSIGLVLSAATRSIAPFLWSVAVGLGITYAFELAFKRGNVNA